MQDPRGWGEWGALSWPERSLTCKVPGWSNRSPLLPQGVSECAPSNTHSCLWWTHSHWIWESTDNPSHLASCLFCDWKSNKYSLLILWLSGKYEHKKKKKICSCPLQNYFGLSVWPVLVQEWISGQKNTRSSLITVSSRITRSVLSISYSRETNDSKTLQSCSHAGCGQAAGGTTEAAGPCVSHHQKPAQVSSNEWQSQGSKNSKRRQVPLCVCFSASSCFREANASQVTKPSLQVGGESESRVQEGINPGRGINLWPFFAVYLKGYRKH